MADKWWKAVERRVAKYFGTERTPLSGGNGKQTRSDTLHPVLFVETKAKKKHTAVSLWDDTAGKAKVEGKTPVVVLCEKGRTGFWVMVHSDDLSRVADARRNLEVLGE